MKIAIASDHAAYALKAELAEWLRAAGHEVADLGTDGTASVDYPDFGYKLAEHVATGKAERGGRAVRHRNRHLDRGQPQPEGPLRAGVRAAFGRVRARP